MKEVVKMKKILAVLLIGLSVNVAHADGWRGGERWGAGEGWRGGEGWGGGDGMGWAIGSALVGGVIGGMMAQQGPVYAQPAPMMAPPVYMPPQPAYAYPPAYVQPVYPAPYYYGRQGWDDD